MERESFGCFIINRGWTVESREKSSPTKTADPKSNHAPVTMTTKSQYGIDPPKVPDRLYRPADFVDPHGQVDRFGSACYPLYAYDDSHHHKNHNHQWWWWIGSSLSSWWWKWSATGNVLDLLYIDLLRIILPTHPAMHWNKFLAVTLLQVVLWCGTAYRLVVGGGLPTSTTTTPTTMPTATLLVLPELGMVGWWTLWILQSVALVAWFWYMHPFVVLLPCEWMDPTIPGWNRLPSHVPLGLYPSKRQARHGAVQWTLPARPDVPTSNLWRLDSREDSTTNNNNNTTAPEWDCCLFPTVQQALHAIQTLQHERRQPPPPPQEEEASGHPQDSDTCSTTASSVSSASWPWHSTAIPSNWTRHEPFCLQNGPVYTNMKYPWPCQPPFVPVHTNPTAIYRRVLTDWPTNDWSLSDGSEYTVLLQGVESACYVYCNGHCVGCSKDSRLPCEFDVTPHLTTTTTTPHELLIVVLRWCDGSYVEDQDHWWMAGLHRSVELVRRPPRADLVHYQCRATAKGDLDVQVYLRPPTRPPQEAPHSLVRSVTFALYQDTHPLEWHQDDDDNVVNETENDDEDPSVPHPWKQHDSSSKNQNAIRKNQNKNPWRAGPCLWEETKRLDHTDLSCHVHTQLDGIQQWTAETPNLYTLVLALTYETTTKDDNTASTTTTTTQVESCRVGFRTISIHDGQLRVNDRPLTICGMNRHEHNADDGKVISVQSMLQDVRLLKQYNFNAVRTSHYPNDSAFYRICDCLGLYVCDEANIETHGMKPMGRLAHDPGWENTFVSRCTRMIHRDINHASILSWSLGNEAGRGCNLVQARRLCQQLDDSRPICYESGGAIAEGTGRTELTDVVCTMYPNVERTMDLATRTDDDRPGMCVHLCVCVSVCLSEWWSACREQHVSLGSCFYFCGCAFFRHGPLFRHGPTVILCEYSHSMGNSNGNLHLYWKEFWNPDIPRLQGGFIWDMIDQGLRVPKNAKQDYYFAYGGDFGDEINDRQFCINVSG